MDMEKNAMDGAPDCKTLHTSVSSCVNDNNNKLYKGVRKRKWGKWVSEIRLPNSRERIWLGSYDSPEKAARAFDAALYCLRGRHANFNFSDTPCNMDTNVAVAVAVAAHQSLTAPEIQEVAAKFANEDPLLLKPLNQESQRGGGDGAGGNSSDNIAESSSGTCTPTPTASSCSTTMHECDGSVQVDHGDMDWTFLHEFDYSNEVFPVGSDYDLYSDLHNVHSTSGELLYSTPPPPPFQGSQDLIEADEDPFSHPSFLWNWNF
ncbi:unnamed protein product [Sphenostylis stenocarpa]|uniref:AP2/ERF domain-containing protein n=1 Tax=Sphenostylis stenocarpa TaxID=92480 RepID=A0AA86T401_9FABA|nr:unnamed protein product [Sphenostylis stenocarpa]